jgi:hypothetical protein
LGAIFLLFSSAHTSGLYFFFVCNYYPIMRISFLFTLKSGIINSELDSKVKIEQKLET